MSILSQRCLPLGAVLHRFKGYPFISIVTYSYTVRPSFRNSHRQAGRISDAFIILFSRGGGLTTQSPLQCPSTNGAGRVKVKRAAARRPQERALPSLITKIIRKEPAPSFHYQGLGV